MRKIVSIILAAAVAVPVAAVLPVATALTITLAAPNSAEAWGRWTPPGRHECVNEKMRELRVNYFIADSFCAQDGR